MPKYLKWLAILFAALLVIVGISAVGSQKAAAAEPTSISTAVHIDKAAPAIKVVPEQRIGGGIVKPFYRWLDSSYCYWSGISTRSYYCYRYACTYFERVAWGCYDGYVRITTYTYA